MVKVRTTLVLAALTALTACFPPALDETGKRCVLPFRQCGPGYVCLAGHCAVEGTELDGGENRGQGKTQVVPDARKSSASSTSTPSPASSRVAVMRTSREQSPRDA